MKTLTAIIGLIPLSDQSLSDTLIQYCPSLTISKMVKTVQDLTIAKKEETPELIFIDAYNLTQSDLEYLKNQKLQSEFIVVLDKNQNNQFTIPFNTLRPIGYLFKPLNIELLILTLETVKRIISSKKLLDKSSIFKNKIGIPTMDGLDFIDIKKIIRCEGLTNCTKIITHSSSKNIISSYNIGEFKKLLIPFGFYSPHKSHLINISFVDKYKKEGVIKMQFDEKAIVPVARSKRTEFLSFVNRL